LWRKVDPAIHGVGRWEGVRSDHAAVLGVQALWSDDTNYRALKDLGLSHGARRRIKRPPMAWRVQKNFSARDAEIRAKSTPATPVEVVQDGSGFGQEKQETYRGTERAHAPRRP